jgi:signal transduction histidine kinase
VLGFIFAATKRAGPGFTERDEALVTMFAAHAALALTNARLYEQARQLSVLEERARLARELHDAVSQKLFSIRVKARAASMLATRDAERAVTEMQSVAGLAGDAHAELRAVIDGLDPPQIAEGGLAESLRRYARLAGTAHGVKVVFMADDLPELGPRRDGALYRIATEALHNALRHAGAAEVRMSVCAVGCRVTLEVSDDGSGFVPGLPTSGVGLASMRDRAAAAGGTLDIRSAPERGTTVRLVLPAVPGSPCGAQDGPDDGHDGPGDGRSRP